MFYEIFLSGRWTFRGPYFIGLNVKLYSVLILFLIIIKYWPLTEFCAICFLRRNESLGFDPPVKEWREW